MLYKNKNKNNMSMFFKKTQIQSTQSESCHLLFVIHEWYWSYSFSIRIYIILQFCKLLASLRFSWASLVAQRVKRLPAMQETWVWSLGREDPLEKEKATHSSTLAWRIPRIAKPGRLQSIASQKSQTRLNDFTFT